MEKFRIFTYLLFIILLFHNINGHSQENEDITAPVLKNASIINDEGDVKLRWELTDTINSDIAIERDSLDIDAFIQIHLIKDTSINTWIDRHAKANNKSRAYKLAYSLEGPGVPSSNKFNTTNLEINFDICDKENQLIWSRHVNSSEYINFNDNIQIEFWNIYRSKDGSDYKKIDSTSNDTSYTDKDIDYNHIYKYYVEGVRSADTSIKTKSNRVSINTDMPDSPDYIRFERLNTEDDQISMALNIAGNSELENYVLLRTNTLSGPWDTLKTFNTSENHITYTDEEADPKNTVHYYHMASVNSCGALTTSSDTLNNIRLNVEKQNMNNVLEWNQISHMNDVSIRYNIYRKIGETGEYTNLHSTHQPSHLDEEIKSLSRSKKDTSARFCYYIQAEIEHKSGPQSIVTSNTECEYIKPETFIPNAIIPNYSGPSNNESNNREFKPVFTFEPEHYLLIIYNRNGAKVFETKNIDNPWKGKIRGGKKAPAGTYIYYLEYQNPGQKMIRKKGEITVIYQK